MLFKDKLDYYDQIIKKELEELLNKAFHTQSHRADLLLLNINGFHLDKSSKVRNNPMHPFVFGLGSIGHSELLHNEFLLEFSRPNVLNIPYSDFKKEREYPTNTGELNEELYDKILTLVKKESYVIQMEMLVYLKIWESTLYLKNLYQLVRLLKGEHYDWFFKLKTANTPNGIATAQELIRKCIRDEIRPFSPILADLIAQAYKSQIRNSIAHSNYSMLGRSIYLNNSNNQYANIESLHFDEWNEMYHISVALYNSYNWMKDQISKFYIEKLPNMGHYINLRFTKKDATETQYPVFYDEIRGWCWVKP